MKVLILGYGLSGQSAFDYLERNGYEAEFAKEEFLKGEALVAEKEIDRLFLNLSFIVTSPGIPLDHWIVVEGKKRKIKIIGELELGAGKISSNLIAVTGTNGKTTTTSLVYFLLGGYDEGSVFVGGNIGVPVTSFSDKTKKQDVVVLECSSFQLESVQDFKPNIALILNLSEDHLSRHKTMENYAIAKFNITKFQDENDILILNADDEFLMKNKPKTKAKVFYFSTQKIVLGAYLKNNAVWFFDGTKQERLVSVKNIKLFGKHNLSNILAATLAVFLQTKNKKLLEKISLFNPVPHRLEFVKTVKGVKFFNDSKATNIDSTLVALGSFCEPLNLILGGSDKGYGFDKIFANLPKNVKNIAIFGQTKQKIAFSAKKFGFENFFFCDDLRACVLGCFEKSNKGDVVLLSPACASFDQFLNFEERGNVFKKIVNEL